eukprot:TRINITY_DN11676_c5_g1_i1.p1 TRINITY_DN11676_c5_g1~~TRINITY_DN11676_c5_g1_i1.p1  ORF type:complete len:519 (-),score=119.54 TRINITY_DN11676_c5_g1_i1:122-1678(-)
MKLDVNAFRYITKDEFRVLTAVEMGMRNHEHVPTPLVESIAKISRSNLHKVLSNLLRNKLLAHDGSKYDGWRMTYHGYDYLAIRALAARGSIVAVGRRLGVGKESDVHYAQGANGELVALKLHRLGRISFRAIKTKRDYLGHRSHASWMYMARLAAAKEFAYMKALKDEGFPVPTPVDQNRHCVVMSFVKATPLLHLRALKHPHQALERLMRLLVRLLKAGIVHGDFNEFNLMLDQDDTVTLIDFPQIVTTTHANAEEFFDRDVKSVCDFFRKRLNIDVQEYPRFRDVVGDAVADANLNSLKVDGFRKEDDAMLVAAHEQSRTTGEGGAVGDDDSDGDDDDDDDEDGDDDDENEAAKEGSENAPAEKEAAEDAGLFALWSDKAGKEALAEDGEALELPPDEEEKSRETECGFDFKAPPRPPHLHRPRTDAVADKTDKDKREDGEDDESDFSGDSEAEEDEAEVGKVSIATTKRVRKKASAKEARSNLQKQAKKKPAKANNSKNKDTRRAKAEIKEWLS